MASADRVALSDPDLSPFPSPVAAAAAPAPVGAQGAPWQVAQGSRGRKRSLWRQEQRRLVRRRQLPAAHPPAHRFLPQGLHGLCYNCARPGHISIDYTNDVRCINCGADGHMSRACTLPRRMRVGAPERRPSGSGGAGPDAAAAPLREVLPPPPPGPPPPGAVRLDRTWSRVVREGSEESTAHGPAFSIPFMQSQVQVDAAPREPAPVVAPELPPCFLEYTDELQQMETQLRRAVVVTVVGAKPVDIAEAERLLQAVFRLGQEDISIRPFSPEDFLVLCKDEATRSRMVAQGLAVGPAFSLSLRGWLRQAHATAVNLPFLVPIELKGIPANAWNRRTADRLLDGVGFIVDVAPPSARRDDMSAIRVWARALDPARLPASRALLIEEPPVPEVRPPGRHRGPAVQRRARTLRYDVQFRVLAEAALAVVDDGSPPPPPPPPPPPSRSPTPPRSPSRSASRESSPRCSSSRGGWRILCAGGGVGALHATPCLCGPGVAGEAGELGVCHRRWWHAAVSGHWFFCRSKAEHSCRAGAGQYYGPSGKQSYGPSGKQSGAQTCAASEHGLVLRLSAACGRAGKAPIGGDWSGLTPIGSGTNPL
jgi:hypothetical protein